MIIIYDTSYSLGSHLAYFLFKTTCLAGLSPHENLTTDCWVKILTFQMHN